MNNACIENSERFLLSPIADSKSYTLVLDIDETLLSVRRWIDEVQINDYVHCNKLNQRVPIIGITKEVTLQYDDGMSNVYSFYFTREQPFGQLSSSLDVGDRMDIGGRLASVKEVLTTYVTVLDGEGQHEIQVNCLNDEYLSQLQYVNNAHYKGGKFSKPDLVYNNLYLVRFRDGLADFFTQMVSYKELEIVLWTAAVRKVYTGLMREVERMLLAQMKLSNVERIWSHILFRDNCTSRANGSYYKDLALLGRDTARLIMLDNISFNFQGFEHNGLPIQEYWGHINDSELAKFCALMKEMMAPTHSRDVRHVLHRLAFVYNVSTYKLDMMLRYLECQSKSTSSPTPSVSQSQSTSSQEDTEAFNHDEVELDLDDLESSASSQSNAADSDASEQESEEQGGSDSTPTAWSSGTASVSNEDEKHLDFYLFNLSPALIDEQDIIDDDMFNDVDPTILLNQSYQ